MSKKSLNKKYWVLIKSNNKYRSFVTTDVRNQLNVLVRFNPSFELIGIYDKEIEVSSDDWVNDSLYNGSEEENLVGTLKNHSNKSVSLKFNSFEVAELKRFAWCAENRIYIRKNEFEDVSWDIPENKLKFGEIENLTFVSDDEVGDYDIQRYYNCYKLNKLVGGVVVSGWVVINDRKRE